MILAISGGMDSMVLAQKYINQSDIKIAHFNHGTRPSSDADEEFVRAFAKRHRLPFFCKRADLGENVSEEAARNARYDFFHRLAEEHRDKIVTAHHLNDFVETVVINLLRGTGWRGLTPFSDSRISRPFLDYPKSQIIKIAASRKVVFREDPTNSDDYYLRNRLRSKVGELPNATLLQVFALGVRQRRLRDEIESILETIIPEDGVYQRSQFKDLDDDLALEILRAAFKKANIKATRPQLKDFLRAIRTYAPGKVANLPGGILIKLHQNHFMLK